jgi:hypothetical protein
MRYYVRRNKQVGIEGLFSAEELADQLNDGTLPPESLASSDLGENMERLEKFRSCDWFQLSEIPNLRGLYPPAGPRLPMAQPTSRRSMLVGGLLMAMAASRGVPEHKWLSWLCAAAALAVVVAALMDAVNEHQRKQTSG